MEAISAANLSKEDTLVLLKKAYEYLLMYQDFREHVKSFNDFIEKLKNNTL